MSELVQKISEIKDPKELGPVVVAALEALGFHGKEGADAVIEAMQTRGDEFTDSGARGNVQEALSWLGEEISAEMDFHY